MASLFQFPLAYQDDPLGAGFSCATLKLPDDHEGPVVAKLIRKRANLPTKKAVLYIHGFIDYFFQAEMALEFNQHDYDFYALDLRKYGRALLPHQTAYDVRDLREYDAEISQALDIIWREGHQSLILAGHSTGGLICASFAARNSKHPLIKGLWLNSPFFDFNVQSKVGKYALRYMTKFANIWPNLSIPSGLSRFYVPSLHQELQGEWAFNLKLKPQHYPVVRLSFIHAVHQVQQELQRGIRLSLPTLVMHSHESFKPKKWSNQVKNSDVILNVNDIDRCTRHIQGDVQIVAIKQAMHDVILSKKPVRELAYQTLFTWLNSRGL